MAEVTKVTTPMIPKENMASRLKPLTDQALELTEPGKVHKADHEGKPAARQTEGQNILKDSMGRAAVIPLLKNMGDMMQIFKKIAYLVESGVSASDVISDQTAKELLDSLFTSPGKFMDALIQQDKSSVLFKGEAFDVLRDLLSKFGDNPKVKGSIANLLKIFDYNVNSQNSVKTILYSCNSILDYMFTKDREQFGNYLQSLADMMLPQKEADAFAAFRNPQPETPEQTENAAQPQNTEEAETAAKAQNPEQAGKNAPTQNPEQAGKNAPTQNPEQAGKNAPTQNPEQAGKNVPTQNPEQAGKNVPMQNPEQAGKNAPTQNPEQAGRNVPTQNPEQPGNTVQTQKQAGYTGEAQAVPMEPKETAQILKNNLLPLLGEIVVKYHQNEKIRDTVMVVVHNIVRADQGTPEALKDAVGKLLNELKQIANVPPGFEKNLAEAIKQNVETVKQAPNDVMSKIADIVSKTLTSPDANPAMLKHAENLLVSMLQNQNSMMDILHYMIPFKTPEGNVFTEIYVDPETGEKVGRQQGKSHKIFLSVETEAHGSFELCFLETDAHVDFSMWCPEELVKSLSGLKRQFSSMMQMHGYTMNSFSIDEMREPHSVAEVFPRLLEKKVGFDVQA